MTTTADPTPATDRWAAINPVRDTVRSRASAAVTRRIFDRVTGRLGISVSTDGRPADLVLHRPEEFFRRVGSDGLIGFGEAYLTGAWDAEHLGDVLTVLCREITDIVPGWMQRLRAAYDARPPLSQRNTESNTRGNIAHHYDLSNELFATFLDPTLSYSSAMFEADAVAEPDPVTGGTYGRLVAPSLGQPLEAAQLRKVDRILDAAGVDAGTRLLEIGTGWGELAIRAAGRGATVRSVTLSSEQQRLARERIAAAGLGDRVTVDLSDYRAVAAEGDGYDAIVSVEMVEAVGHEYWPTYFAALDRLLAPGGRAAIQAITMPHRQVRATRNTWTWINKYVFPGGFLPSVTAIEEITREHTSLRVTDRLSFGSHYAETLRQWDASFIAAGDDVLALGFDETFRRLWHFYLEYSRAGFESGYLDVHQLTLTRGGR